ncbi:hypothetical protein FSP39_013451 [Pinctada imbricata]|uniref:DNA 3'-5' helicase n=1 Tax=Pinctada imbricata TaxID=66713 RepID=A0AA88Y7P9_PINIB|nr:hypothetical protein FSP39_013451 [Pinctada imbricata]
MAADERVEEIILEEGKLLYPNLDMTDDQVDAISVLIKGHDLVVNLPVGSGKSLIFHLLPDAVKNTDIFICHPEALITSENADALLLSLKDKIGAIVIDECHKIDDWGKKFRKSFAEIGSLKSFFPAVPFLCMSGTLTESQLNKLPKDLGMNKPVVISKSPEITNLYLEVIKKDKGSCIDVYEEIFIREIEKLVSLGPAYPVTLMFIPMQYMSFAMRYACKAFHEPTLDNAIFGAIFSNQDADVLDKILSDLKKDDPQYRLIFATSFLGMGYDSSSVSQVIHARPPRSVTNYIQEIGRAGRKGQEAKATLHYCKSDISSNLPGLEKNIVDYCLSKTCLRTNLLKVFGFCKSSNSPVGCRCCSVCKDSCTCDSCQNKDA